MALKHEPTAPYHSAQDALRVLETVAHTAAGVTETELARHTGLGPERLTVLLRMLRRGMWSRSAAGRTSPATRCAG